MKILKTLKYFTFWFVLFSLIVCLINLSGNDEKNILIFLTNPIHIFLEKWLTSINTNSETSHFFRPIIYLLHLVFWGVIGLTIDGLIVKIKNTKKMEGNN